MRADVADAVVVTGSASARDAGDAALAALPEPLRTRATRAERITRLVLLAGTGALEAAGLAVSAGPPRAELGVVLGTMFGCFLTNAAYAERLGEAGPPGASPRLFAATVSNAAAGELAIAYGLGGPTATLAAGRASGLVALGHAADLIRDVRAATIVTGGADATGEPLEQWLQDAGLALDARPRDAASLVVVESIAAARTRGAPILATILGWAATFDPRPIPRGEAAEAAAVDAALADAGLERADIERVVTSSAAEAGREVQARLRRSGADGAGPGATRTGAPAPLSRSPRPNDLLAASGPHTLLTALAEARRGTTLVVATACATTGHAAAVVAKTGELT